MHRMTLQRAPSRVLQRPECSEEPKETLIQQLNSFEVSDHRVCPQPEPSVPTSVLPSFSLLRKKIQAFEKLCSQDNPQSRNLLLKVVWEVLG